MVVLVMFKVLLLIIFIFLTIQYLLKELEIIKSVDSNEVKEINSWFNFVDYSVKVFWLILIPILFYLIIKGVI